MSVRTEWSRVVSEVPAVVAEYTDAYGTGLDEGNVALVLGSDSVYVIEASSVDDIRSLAHEILGACEAFDAERNIVVGHVADDQAQATIGAP